MSTKKICVGLAALTLTIGLALPAQADWEERGSWGWLTLLWSWFGVEAPAEAPAGVDHEILPAGVAADPFGRIRLTTAGTPPTDEADAGVAADPFG